MKAFTIAIVLLGSAAAFALPVPSHSSSRAPMTTHPIPRLVQRDGRYALIVDGVPFLMLGAQSNNSSDWPATLPKVWPAIEYLHANTLETPIYWEQLESKPGQFDYSEVDLLLAQARQHHVHLVLLWFGTWKNRSQHSTPCIVLLQSRPGCSHRRQCIHMLGTGRRSGVEMSSWPDHSFSGLKCPRPPLKPAAPLATDQIL